MESRHLVILILILTFSFTFIVIAIFAVYKYDPVLLGFPPKPGDTLVVDSVKLEPTIAVSEQKLRSLEFESIERERLTLLKDSLLLVRQNLLDSITIIERLIAGYRDSVAHAHRNITASSGTISFLNDSLSRLYSKYKSALDRIDLSKKTIDDQEKFIQQKQDTSIKKNFEEFARLYNNANPIDVARILEQIDERDAAAILKLMQKKKAGKVIEALRPERAASILLLGGSQ